VDVSVRGGRGVRGVFTCGGVARMGTASVLPSSSFADGGEEGEAAAAAAAAAESSGGDRE
jgi:hypothetical protein